jgi:hypothetical protein
VSCHRIRLPAPWRVTRSAAAAASASASAGSTVVFSRNFQRPTGLTDQSSVALEITLLEPLPFSVALNGAGCPIVGRSELSFEAALSPDRLCPVNRLEITLQLPAPRNSGSSVGDQLRFGQDYLSQVELVLA